MKWLSNNIKLLISFFIGVLVCYMCLQVQFFEIKKELDIPNIILSTITLFIGLFIAITIQKNITKGQNNHSFLINKIDRQWNHFNEFSEGLALTNNIDISLIQSFIKNVIHPSSFLIRVFNSINIESSNLEILENKLDELEVLLSDIPASDNVIDISTQKNEIETKVQDINIVFAKIFTQIQNV